MKKNCGEGGCLMFFDVCMKDNGYREVDQTNVKALQNIKAARLNSPEDRVSFVEKCRLFINQGGSFDSLDDVLPVSMNDRDLINNLLSLYANKKADISSLISKIDPAFFKATCVTADSEMVASLEILVDHYQFCLFLAKIVNHRASFSNDRPGDVHQITQDIIEQKDMHRASLLSSIFKRNPYLNLSRWPEFFENNDNLKKQLRLRGVEEYQLTRIENDCLFALTSWYHYLFQTQLNL